MVAGASLSQHLRPDIEGLRAIAIGLVLLYHAQLPWFPGGFIGVDVFFVISGFVITSSLIREAEEHGRIDIFNFYAKRVRRLLPAAALTLLITAIAVRVLLPPSMWADFGGDIAAAAAYFVNFRLAARSVDYLAQDVGASPVQHYWSLSVEEQFYLIWPALVLLAVVLARRWKRGPKVAVGMVVLALVVAPSLVYNLWQTARDPAAAFFVTPTRLWQLGVGALVASVWHRFPQPGRLATPLKLLALAVLVWVSVFIDTSTPWPGTAALVPVLATALLILLGGRGRDGVEQVLALTPFQRIGAWSYSLYLWHWPPLALAAAAGGDPGVRKAIALTAISFVPAVLSYRLVENPIRFHPRLVRAPRFSVGMGVSLSLLGVVTGLLVVVSTPRAAPQSDGPLPGAAVLREAVSREELLRQLRDTTVINPLPEEATRDRPSLYADECQVNRSGATPVVCERGDPRGDVTVMLIGDSKIAQYEPALDDIGKRRGWKIVVTTKSTCPLITRMPLTEEGDGPYESCHQWIQSVFEIVEDVRPDVVLTSHYSEQAWDPDTGAPSVEEMYRGMLEAYESLEGLGAEVILVRNNIVGDFVVRDCVSANRDDLERCIIPWEDVDGKGSGVLQERVAEDGSYGFVDPTDLLCPQQLCLPVIGGVLVYRDGTHITATYVKTMTPFLEERLVEAAGGRLP